MSPLATIHYPDLNPIGAPSAFATCVVVVLAVLTMPQFRVPKQLRSFVTAFAPFLLVFLAWPVMFERFQDADDCTAVAIFLVFGFGFALNCLSSPGGRVIGWLFTLIIGWLLVMFVCRWLLVWSVTPTYAVLSRMHWGATVAFVTIWTPTLVLLDRRVRKRLREQRGCCPVCNYNLTGNLSGVCPECGNPV